MFTFKFFVARFIVLVFKLIKNTNLLNPERTFTSPSNFYFVIFVLVYNNTNLNYSFIAKLVPLKTNMLGAPLLT